MVSICIPIYNNVSEDLVFQLWNQISVLQINAEIILYDDGSELPPDHVYKQAETIPDIHVHKSSKNLGRSASRNQLAKIAKHPYLLFIDADSEVPDKHYLERYVKHIEPGVVCCGGTIYKSQKPEFPYILRWKYGKKRESIKASERQKFPWQQFTTHHFLIDKNIFISVGEFCEQIQGYGHEDTLFGYELKKQNIPVVHIDNPLYHTGLEPARDFLDKSKNAVRNLLLLYIKHRDDPDFVNNVRLLRFYQKQKNFRLLLFWRLLYSCFHLTAEHNLTSKYPSVSLFNLYKFSYLAHIINGFK